jgi:hypothetical protein
MAGNERMAKAVDSRLAKARAAGRLRRDRGDLAVSASFDVRRRRLHVELLSGSAVAVPVERVQGLAGAKASQLRAVEVTGRGYGLYWPALDVDVAVPDLVAGCFGSKAWMSALARLAGSTRSAAKAAASRANGKKGGRPRKASTAAGPAASAD